jgi:hypothetical protein
MIWLTWRQFRAQAATAVAAVAGFAILLAVTRPHMDSLYAASGISGCQGRTCGGLASAFLNDLASATPFGGRGGSLALLPDGTDLYPILYSLGLLLIVTAPAIIGMFWGAPLIARELETGTCRVAWNQSVTRNRWLTVKLTLTGLAALAVAEAFCLMQAWWAAPIGRAMVLGGTVSVFNAGRFNPLNFATHGITPLGYAAFGFALGVTLGVLIRRTVPAMALTLAIFAAIQVAMPLWVRPHLMPPDQTIATTQATQANWNGFYAGPVLTASVVPGQPGAWIISSGAVNVAGHPVSTVPALCLPTARTGLGRTGGRPQSEGGLQRCLDSHGIREEVSYQPVSRYWPFQLAETGIFLALALALAWFCFWRLGRRLS